VRALSYLIKRIHIYAEISLQYIDIFILCKHCHWYGNILSLQHLALLGQAHPKPSPFLTFTLQIAINVKICFTVMANYVSFSLTNNDKGGDEAP